MISDDFGVIFEVSVKLSQKKAIVKEIKSILGARASCVCIP